MLFAMPSAQIFANSNCGSWRNASMFGCPDRNSRRRSRGVWLYTDKVLPGRATGLGLEIQRQAPVTPSEVKFAVDLYGAFPVKRLFWVVLRVFCSERERPFFVPSPAIRSPERAEGVKGPKR